jgi:MFS transporter, DHA3 family, macrolide efflux protein
MFLSASGRVDGASHIGSLVKSKETRMAQQPQISAGMRTFLFLLVGQVVSLIGSGLTGFALGVWVFERTGSATQFALIALSATLPGIVLAPLSGALVDRWDRRTAMVLGDTMSALSTLVVAVLVATGQLQVWHIYVANAWSSTFSTLQGPAFGASISLLVSKNHLGRANGMAQLGLGISQIISPVLAGILIGTLGLRGVILIDFITYLFALATYLFVRIPRPTQSAEGKAAKGSLWHEAGYGWVYLLARPGLLALLVFFAISNLAIGMVQVLITPLVLSFASPEQLGTVLSIAGSGLLAGSVVMSIWGGPTRKVFGILGLNICQGLILFLGGLQPSVPLIATAAFLFLFSPPIINGCSQAIWQRKTPPDIQGRVLAVRMMIAWSTLPLAYLIAGPLADRVFEPAMAVNGPLAGSIGALIGTGPGRGIGLLFIALGAFILLTTWVGILYPRLRRVELELPDAIPDTPPLAADHAVTVGLQPQSALGTGGDGH